MTHMSCDWHAIGVWAGDNGRPRGPRSDGRPGFETEGRQKLRVMIVEDELFVAMHLESLLEDLGYEVTGIVSNGETAISEFRLQRPEIVLMDMNLGGGIDGLIAAQQIRAVNEVCVIFVTAYSDRQTLARIEAVLPGACVLSKPVTPGILQMALEAQPQGPH